MRKVYMILMLLLTVSVASAQQKELFVLHTSDTHSRIEPLETTSADRYRGMGGVARRSAYIKQMRELHPNLLLLDCGDISQDPMAMNAGRLSIPTTRSRFTVPRGTPSSPGPS